MATLTEQDGKSVIILDDNDSVLIVSSVNGNQIDSSMIIQRKKTMVNMSNWQNRLISLLIVFMILFKINMEFYRYYWITLTVKIIPMNKEYNFDADFARVLNNEISFSSEKNCYHHYYKCDKCLGKMEEL